MAGPAERLDDDAQILAAVAMNPGAIGIVNATSVQSALQSPASEPANPPPTAANPPTQTPAAAPPPPNPAHNLPPPPQDPLTKQGLTVLAIAGPNPKPTQPRPESIFAGQYLLAELLLAYLAPAASPCAAEVFLQSLNTPSAQEAMKSQGITPIPPAPAR